MSRNDATLQYWSDRIESLRTEYEKAKERTSALKAEVDSTWGDLQPLYEKYCNYKAQADYEFSQASYCWDVGDRASAKAHSENGHNLNNQKRILGSSLDVAKQKHDVAKDRFDAAVAFQKSIKNDLEIAKSSHKARIGELKELRAKDQLHWHEKTCKRCGCIIRYRDDWNHIPNYCKDCKKKLDDERQERKAKEDAKWKDKPCKRCGKSVKYKIDWQHPPNYCEECKQEFEKEKNKKNWLVQDDNENATVMVSANYLERNPQFGKDPDTERTDILVIDKSDNKHVHYSIGEDYDWDIKKHHGWQK